MNVRLALALLALLLVVFAVYWRGLYRDPYVNCKKCNGSGQHHPWYGKPLKELTGYQVRHYGMCSACKGKPRKYRFGARVLLGKRDPT